MSITRGSCRPSPPSTAPSAFAADDRDLQITVFDLTGKSLAQGSIPKLVEPKLMYFEGMDDIVKAHIATLVTVDKRLRCRC